VLGDVREGLSVVDVALLDARDRELRYYATSSFHIASGGTCPVGASATCRLATIGCWRQKIETPFRTRGVCSRMEAGAATQPAEDNARPRRLEAPRRRRTGPVLAGASSGARVQSRGCC
jgi:hypothetical protein